MLGLGTAGRTVTGTGEQQPQSWERRDSWCLSRLGLIEAAYRERSDLSLQSVTEENRVWKLRPGSSMVLK